MPNGLLHKWAYDTAYPQAEGYIERGTDRAPTHWGEGDSLPYPTETSPTGTISVGPAASAGVLGLEMDRDWLGPDRGA